MEKQDFIDAGIDYDDGVNRFIGRPEMFISFLKRFPADTTYQELEQAMNEKNIKKAFQAGHTIKGVAGNLSLSRLYNVLVPFVDALRGDDDIDKAASLYPQVKEEYTKAVSFIEQL